jgi:predicted esterase/tetratricopeptide (TPR) repeat protein
MATRFGGQAQDNQTVIPLGQVVEKVVCAQDSNQTYALYLPSNYVATRKWPVLYAFDPGARGKIPVERFKDAAERFGWIVVGSNNSRNASVQSSIDAWNAMTRDTTGRFSVDDNRAYAAGFSGGARVSLLIATQCKDCLAGVIAGSAGFPVGIDPANTMRFALFLMAGTDDFNFAEIKSLEEGLVRANITYQIETFPGRHEWPGSSVATDAVAWMELMGMKSARRERDPQFIESWQTARLKQAREFEDAKKAYEAYQTYLELSSALKGLSDIAEIENKVNQLRNSREVREAIRDEQQQIKKQRDLEGQLAGLIAASERMKLQNGDTGGTANGRPDDASLDPEGRLHALLGELNRQTKGEQDTATRRIARRVLEGKYVGLFERGMPLLQNQKRSEEAARIFTVATEVAPERAGGFYYLAWAYSAKGDKKKSLKALQIAVDKGFSDVAGLESNKAFDTLRDDPQYQKIISALKVRR